MAVGDTGEGAIVGYAADEDAVGVGDAAGEGVIGVGDGGGEAV